jgi:transposase
LSETDVISVAGGWEGYRVVATCCLEVGVTKRLEVQLAPAEGLPPCCAGCGQTVTRIHETITRKVRDLPILDAQTWLLVPRRRLLCPHCGPSIERLTWLDRYARVTRRLAESVVRLCRVLTVKHVADFFGLSWDQVKEIDKRALRDQVGTVDLSSVEVIGMDEFALHKGHRYATVVVEPYRKEVLWIGQGRSRESIRPFFELLGAGGCRRLKAVVMDMNASYEQEVRQHSPKAAIVYDLFHVVAKFGREVIDRVRVDEANRLQHDKKARKVVKTSRWLLLRNRQNVKGGDMLRLQELLEANQNLMTVYVLKEDLKQLWRFNCVEEASLFWEQWYRRAVESGIQPLMLFARRLKGYLHGILNHCDWPLHTGLLEGINNRIKVIKRMAYGFRDHEYFFLKIRAAFPGIPG